MKDIPFYLDWQFWSAIAALVLSQFPPLKFWFKKGKITIEKYGTLFVTHSVGSPILHLFVILKNVGGSSINVHSIDMKIKRKNTSSFILRGRGYAMHPSDYNFTMFTPVEIRPDQTWAHTVSFNELWDRTKQKEYKAFYSNIRDVITEKNRVDPLGIGEKHEIDAIDYQKLCKFFDKNFKWFDGEYEAEILVKDKEDNVIAKDLVKFTLFESETDELNAWVEEYKYGNGIHLVNSQKQNGVSVDLSD